MGVRHAVTTICFRVPYQNCFKSVSRLFPSKRKSSRAPVLFRIVSRVSKQLCYSSKRKNSRAPETFGRVAEPLLTLNLRADPVGEVGGWGRDPFSRNFMKPTPRRKWYLTTGRTHFDAVYQLYNIRFMVIRRGGGLGSRPIFKKFHETYAPS